MPALEHLVLPLENFLQRKKLKVPQDINSIESSFWKRLQQSAVCFNELKCVPPLAEILKRASFCLLPPASTSSCLILHIHKMLGRTQHSSNTLSALTTSISPFFSTGQLIRWAHRHSYWAFRGGGWQSNVQISKGGDNFVGGAEEMGPPAGRCPLLITTRIISFPPTILVCKIVYILLSFFFFFTFGNFY